MSMTNMPYTFFIYLIIREYLLLFISQDYYLRSWAISFHVALLNSPRSSHNWDLPLFYERMNNLYNLPHSKLHFVLELMVPQKFPIQPYLETHSTIQPYLETHQAYLWGQVVNERVNTVDKVTSSRLNGISRSTARINNRYTFSPSTIYLPILNFADGI